MNVSTVTVLKTNQRKFDRNWDYSKKTFHSESIGLKKIKFLLVLPQRDVMNELATSPTYTHHGEVIDKFICVNTKFYKPNVQQKKIGKLRDSP